MRMILHFPDNFIWGTSTAAAQIETATAHEWRGIRSKDGFEFNQTCDHEKRRKEDAVIIADIAPHYRMSLDWAILQDAPFAPLNPIEINNYLELKQYLRSRGVQIMLVLHHLTKPQ